MRTEMIEFVSMPLDLEPENFELMYFEVLEGSAEPLAERHA